MTKNKKTYYITTPIYYPSGKWHLGHSYTTVCCDALSRFKRMDGFEVFYQTGTDEHGQKIEERAKAAGKTPQEFVDALVEDIKRLWARLDISYDAFIRTTDPRHKKAVQQIFTTLYDNGDIYKSKYKGRYCTPCESFWTATQSKDGRCPDCGRETVEAEEECYFFRLSAYREPIEKLLTTTDFLQPRSRVNEMVNNFLKEGLEDIAVSRTSFKWGIEVPFDKSHVIYVWIDALSNYITGLGYGSGDDTNYKKFWPADLHLMAKEIVRFHAIIWPAILMALGEPLPKKVYGHGWLLFGGDKMSKSKGNVVDPFILCDRYGLDAVRYYLLREISFGQDCDYSVENLLNRYNADLCNDLGNLVKRTTAMAKQYFGGKVTKPQTGCGTEFDALLILKADGLYSKVSAKLDGTEISKALESIFELISAANKYIDLSRPWILKKEGKTDILEAVIYNLLEAIRIAATLLIPFIRSAPAKIFGSLGLETPTDFKNAKYGKIKEYGTAESEALFLRLDIKKELEELEKLENTQESLKADKKAEAQGANDGIITIDEFFKTKLKVAKVLDCQKVEKSEKLLKLTLEVGNETRTVVSGIAKSYSAEEMLGKEVVLVSNLKPAKLCGIESQGMVLCAIDKDGKPVLVSPEKPTISGGEVC